MILLKVLSCILLWIGFFEAKPFFFSAPKFLSSFISSSSAGSPSFETNIADLRVPKSAKLNDQPNDDIPKPSFVKSQNIDENEEEANNEALPDFLQKKLEKVLQKIQFLSTLTKFQENDDSSSDHVDDFDKEKAAFDNEFNEDHNKANVVDQSGYNYKKPPKSAKQELGVDVTGNDNNDNRLNPGGLGVYFMELVGSIIGLAIGAYASIANGSSTTTTAPIDFN